MESIGILYGGIGKAFPVNVTGNGEHPTAGSGLTAKTANGGARTFIGKTDEAEHPTLFVAVSVILKRPD